ncbi:ATP-binding protein [Methylomarinum sp. Ch1-1]|uniref:histidine kinase n=1 Tax=Methylomarinum roseum TaxID=3067653 RepID=A0AAU7NTN2_9GAMM|nr:ATP-binding protein [Methylomarinum sp. Ch1-1]MDP4519620.1 ATP-binding protein [Methylomarinum sp. Ch1-1]
MTTANKQQAQKAERLTDAFRLFNQLSQNLSDSYQGLETQVAKLTQELAAARSERLKTLVEKEKIAARLQQILAALPAAVVVLDAAEQVIDCNMLAIDLLGEPLLGQGWGGVVQRRLLPVFDTPHERQLSDGRRVNITRNALDNDNGQIVLLSDVSELRSLQDMLAQQKQLSAMGEMVASMAHQVRTPLATAILYASQMNKPAVTDDKRQRFSQKILERLHHLERQVNDMLIFAKQGRLTMEVFSLRHLLARIAENMAEMDIVFDLENRLPVDDMLGNEDALRGALMNVLNNAVEACDPRGRVEMTVSRQDEGSLQIKITDNGEGMSAQQQQRLFEPFFTTKLNGTGLGLAVVDSVVKAHSGAIRCSSTPGQGTTFTLVLPCINQYSFALSSATAVVEREVTNDETV